MFNKEITSQFFKYGIVGLLNFILTISLFYYLLKVIHLNYHISFTVIWIISILFTYIINFLWVFKPEDKIEFKKRFPKYFLVYFSSYLVNILLLNYLVSNLSFDPFYIQFFIIPIVMLINFLGFKYWSLN